VNSITSTSGLVLPSAPSHSMLW